MICHLKVKHTDLMLLVYLLKQQRYATVIYGMDSDETRQADECEYVEKGLSKAEYHFYCVRFCSAVLVLVITFQIKQPLIL